MKHSMDTNQDNPTQPRIMKPAAIASIVFLFTTLIIYLLYRIAFIHYFSPGTSSDDVLLITLYGMRLDTALVAIELALMTLVFLLTRHFRLRAFVLTLITLTLIHIILGLSNILFFMERDQHLWEMLLANITSPDEVLIAILPFIQLHPALITTSLLLTVMVFYFSYRATRQLPGMKLDLWKPRRHLGRGIMLILFFSISNLDAVDNKVKKHWTLGWIPFPTTSQLYMRFDGYQTNQAVVNPFHDFLRFYVPATFTGMSSDKTELLDREEALKTGKILLGNDSSNETYPLMHTLKQRLEPGLKNVIIIQVEGLSQSVIGRRKEGREMTPFMNQLSQKGLYFDNMVQSFNATDGAVFSTATGVHKAFFNQNWKYFLPVEINGYFASLPHLLGTDHYQHFSMHAFHNRRELFSSFMSNQGYKSLDYLDFQVRLGGEEVMPEFSNGLGIFDGFFLQEAADFLAAVDTPYTAHLLTTTTHSPWQIPEDAERPFKNKKANAFHYLDQSIESLFKTLRGNRTAFEETLFVIVADHTSVLYDEGMMERIRVPLIIYNPRLEVMKDHWQPHPGHYASQVDIIPTILQLLDGNHIYSGMGNSLLQETLPDAGAISSNRYDSLYLKGNYALRYSPFAATGDEIQLFEIRNDEIIEDDISDTHPDVVERLRHEYLSLYETSARLAKEKRYIPVEQANSTSDTTASVSR